MDNLLEERLKTIVANVLGISYDEVNDDLDKNSCDEWDSFNHIILINEIEEGLGIQIPIDDSERIDSYFELAQTVEKRLCGK